MLPSASRKSPMEKLRIITEGTAAATGDEFFRSLARHAAQALGARYAFAAESLSDIESRSLAYWEGSDYGAGFSYRFPGTPCQKVASGLVCHTRTNLQALFPDDRWLVDIGADGYVGVPMKNAEGRVLGHVAVLHTEPLDITDEDIEILKIFAARGCAELERLQAERELRAAEQQLRRALEEVEQLKERLEAENVYLQEEIRNDHNFEEIVGSSNALLGLLRKIEQAAASDATVLIQGETGTGKELVARALHSRSRRSDRPLVKVNCAAISAGLVESELFGHVKGAFTGALNRRVGRFELADGGTLFLDEVGELPPETQAKLLRVLQEQEFEPVGSNETRRVNVRVIAATNRNLQQAVADGQFRSDLFYRLNVVPLNVPPLREHREDIPLLTSYFLQRYCRRQGREALQITREAMDMLLAYPWPGNIRELQNLVERAVVLSPGASLTAESLALNSGTETGAPQNEGQQAITLSMPVSTNFPPLDGAVQPLQELERQHFYTALEKTRWVIEGPAGAARMLGLNPSTFRSRMKKLGISRTSH